MNTYQPHRSSLGGLDANIMALLCYLVTFVGGLIPVVKYVAWLLPLVIVFLEKESGLVKFHAMQAFVLNLISFVVTVLITIPDGSRRRGGCCRRIGCRDRRRG